MGQTAKAAVAKQKWEKKFKYIIGAVQLYSANDDLLKRVKRQKNSYGAAKVNITPTVTVPSIY